MELSRKKKVNGDIDKMETEIIEYDVKVDQLEFEQTNKSSFTLNKSHDVWVQIESHSDCKSLSDLSITIDVLILKQYDKNGKEIRFYQGIPFP